MNNIVFSSTLRTPFYTPTFQLRGLYDNRNQFKTHLAETLVIISAMHNRLGNYKQSIEALEGVIVSTPDELHHAMNIAQVMKNISNDYSAMGNQSKAKEYMKKALKSSLCEDRAHFMAVYPDVN